MTTGGSLENTAGGAGAAVEPPGASAADAGGDVRREIEEADLVRASGDTLFLLNAYRGLAVVDLAQPRVVGRLALGGFPHEMYVRGARALALVSANDGTAALLDVSLADLAAPSQAARFPLVGMYRASRLVGNVLYVVTDVEVASFAVGASVAAVDTEALPSPGAFVAASDALLAVAGWDDGTSTPITLVDIADPLGTLVERGTIALPGWIADEHKLDLYGTVLRVVTHDMVDGGLSRCMTVDVTNPDLPLRLATLPLARGEQLFATRFDGPRAYVVTFERVDPLWVLDLSNPAAPVVAGELVVPGWSTQLVPTGDGRLVALGIDPADGWHAIASLFDVHDPKAPTLADRVDFGWGWSTAFDDTKALGVYPADGLVLVPFSGEDDRLAVLTLGASTLDLRGNIPMGGPALRGFPHARGLVAVSSEEVAIVDPATLADRARVTIAENVVDMVRVPGGAVLPLVAKRASGRLGTVVLPFVPERAFPYGDRVAVIGWDATGRAAYVVDLAPATPTLSPRFDLGGAWFLLCDGRFGAAAPNGMGFVGGASVADAVLTDDGHLVVRGLPGAGGGVMPPPLGGSGGGTNGGMGMGDGGVRIPLAGASGATDGFVVIDVAAGALDAPITVARGYVSGFVADDGGDLVYTVGGGATEDAMGRPRMRHDLVRVDLATRATTTAVNVPGYVLSAAGDLVYTAEERWGAGWDWACAVVALAVTDTTATVLDRATLPEGAYDFRAAGATLVYTRTTGIPTGSGGGAPGNDGPSIAWGEPGGIPWMPTTEIRTLRLAADLVDGPSLPTSDAFLTVLLVEDGALLVVENGTTLVRYDVAGLAAATSWTVALDAWPMAVRPDGAPGAYLVALGYAGYVGVP
jgi:hypothetical protein